MNTQLENFNKDISQVVEYILNGYEMYARFIFNTQLLEKYSKDINPDNVLSIATELWVLLDEYLNKQPKQNFSEQKNFLMSAYEDYQEDIKKTI
ncbi:hypothetical protein KKG48_02010 [Patescibacteria group bacterium]|nr:hypothetical protein [Patescibacteria group bacterium]MCG2695229.1 hypothetical protein [Candidatus Parcubacteria bacterium]